LPPTWICICWIIKSNLSCVPLSGRGRTRHMRSVANQTIPDILDSCGYSVSLDTFFFFLCFWRTSSSFFVTFSSVTPRRGQPTAKCHPRWQPNSRLAVSCELPRLSLSHHTPGWMCWKILSVPGE
jgi:hypothetical protein